MLVGFFARTELQLEENKVYSKILVIQNSLSKSVFAHAVPQKEADEKSYNVDCFSTDIVWLGLSGVIIRSDAEPAIAKLVVETIKKVNANVVDQAAAEGSVQKNRRATAQRKRP